MEPGERALCLADWYNELVPGEHNWAQADGHSSAQDAPGERNLARVLESSVWQVEKLDNSGGLELHVALVKDKTDDDGLGILEVPFVCQLLHELLLLRIQQNAHF